MVCCAHNLQQMVVGWWMMWEYDGCWCERIVVLWPQTQQMVVG